MDRRTYLGTVGVLTAMSLAGCSRGDTPEETTGPGGTTETATSTQTPSPTGAGETIGQQTFPDYNWELLKDTTGQFTTEIMLRDQSFHPVVAKLPVGSVKFVNEDSYDHTVTIPALDVKKTLSVGGSAEIPIDSVGRYDYVCELHPPSMLGRLLVVEETPTASPTGSQTETSTDSSTESPTDSPTESPTPTASPTETDSGYY